MAIDPAAPTWATGGAYEPLASAMIVPVLVVVAAVTWLHTPAPLRSVKPAKGQAQPVLRFDETVGAELGYSSEHSGGSEA